MLPLRNHIPILLVFNIFFVLSHGCGSNPFDEFSDEREVFNTTEETTSTSTTATTEYPFTESKRTEQHIIKTTDDPPRILCGQAMIYALKEQCGDRGTFSPYSKRTARSLKALTNAIYGPDLTDKMPRSRIRKRFDDYCEVYLRYEPESPISQCCCLGCTRAYLENYCAES